MHWISCVFQTNNAERKKKKEQSQTIVGFVQRKLALDGRTNNNNERKKTPSNIDISLRLEEEVGSEFFFH